MLLSWLEYYLNSWMDALDNLYSQYLIWTQELHADHSYRHNTNFGARQHWTTIPNCRSWYKAYLVVLVSRFILILDHMFLKHFSTLLNYTVDKIIYLVYPSMEIGERQLRNLKTAAIFEETSIPICCNWYKRHRRRCSRRCAVRPLLVVIARCNFNFFEKSQFQMGHPWNQHLTSRLSKLMIFNVTVHSFYFSEKLKLPLPEE